MDDEITALKSKLQWLRLAVEQLQAEIEWKQEILDNSQTERQFEILD